jgi:hypothetical protein
MLPLIRKKKKNNRLGGCFHSLISHTSMSFFEIENMTMPQIESVLSRINKHIGIKIGIPIKDESIDIPEEEHSVDDALAFISAFQGL